MNAIHKYTAPYSQLMGSTTPCARATNLVGKVLLVALFVIGCVGAAGAFSGSAMGWTTLGVGLSYLGVKLLGGNLKERKVDLIAAAVMVASLIIFGALGGVGLLTGAQVGYVLIGQMLLLSALSTCAMIVAKRYANN